MTGTAHFLTISSMRQNKVLAILYGSPRFFRLKHYECANSLVRRILPLSMAVFEYIVYCCHVLQCWLVIKETRRVINEGHKTKGFFVIVLNRVWFQCNSPIFLQEQRRPQLAKHGDLRAFLGDLQCDSEIFVPMRSKSVSLKVATDMS